jgi:acyl-coenzyme A thioesterase PaaI-like protein
MPHTRRIATRRSCASQPQDQRTAVRFDAAMPVLMDSGAGTTHNISTQGVYFETDVKHRPGALVNFSIEFTLHGRRHRLLCEGKVVRVEPQGDRVGVAARLLAPFFEGEEEVAAAPTR